jgi:hypothetical protein
MLKAANHAHDTATELEALVLLLPEKSRQLAQLQVKASHKQAKEFRELAQKVKESLAMFAHWNEVILSDLWAERRGDHQGSA